MMLHKLEDGDRLQLLKIVKKDGTLVDKLSYRFVYINGKFIFDDSNILI
jgi:hypothetical protein